MSQEIDEKVVEMRFDNKQFEREAATTMSTLQDLKKNLDFSKVENSFSTIEKASKKVDISGLGSAVENVKTKFSALEVMAITTLGNITNSAVNAGKKLLSSFTIEPISTGFKEYETQINAVQTILANTQKEGTNINDVNSALDELNTYADKTIYNFTEMTRNIGTFTAAGINLDTSVNAIQGISNLAAVSGSNAQQASTAMYQLSQALSTGTVRLADWNSVVNAGMGGQVFQDALKETSKLLGTGAEEAIESSGSFRESLKEGWLTSKVLTETLKKFTTSGAIESLSEYTGLTKDVIEQEWKAAEAMYGEADAVDKAAEALANKSGKNKDEIAKTMKFSKTAEDAATKVKTFSQLMDTLKEAVQSGWSQSFRIVIGDFEESKELFTEISDSFGEVIGASADARNKLLGEVFNKKDAQGYIAEVVGVSKEAVSELQTIGQEAGTTSDVFKEALNVFTDGDNSMNKVVTNLIDMANSEKDVISYLSDITGMKEGSLKDLQNLGREVGYTSDEFKDLADVLSEGDPEMEKTITHLLEMNDAINKPSGRELLIESIKNAMEGLSSVVKPVRDAFKEVFPPATADKVYEMLKSFRDFTKTLKLSEKTSGKLKTAFKGVFDIIKLVKDGFVKFVKLIIPANKPVSTIADGLLDIFAGIGKALSAFSDWVRDSPGIAKSYDVISDAISTFMSWISDAIGNIGDFATEVYNMEATQKILKAISKAFKAIGKSGKTHISTVIDKLKNLKESLSNSIPEKAKEAFKTFSDAISGLADNLDSIDFSNPKEGIDKLKEAISNFMDTLIGDSGFMDFINNAKEYGSKLKDGFSFDNISENIDSFKETMSGFVDWLRTYIGPFFEGFTIGDALSGGANVGAAVGFVKMAKSFKSLTGTFEVVPDLLNGVKGSVEAYQKDLNASALLKTAKAIGILAAALLLLSFTDTNKLLAAALALSMIGAVFIIAVGVLSKALNKGTGITDVLDTFAKGLSASMKNLSKSLKYVAIGFMFKEISNALIKVAIAIVALGYIYTKHQEYIENGAIIVGAIAGVMVGIIAAMSFLGKKLGSGMNSFSKAAFGIAALAIALAIVVKSLQSFLQIDLPTDWETKFGIISSLLLELGILTIVVGLANRIAGSGKLKSGPIIAMVLGVAALTFVLMQLFKADLPKDWEQKFAILTAIFIEFGALLLIIGIASRIAKGKMKATGSILAMCLFIATATAALLILSSIPMENLLVGAVALGAILFALGVALIGAGTISNEKTGKTVLAMAIMVGVIALSLMVLSQIPAEQLLATATILAGLLVVLAICFKSVSKITNEKSWMTVVAMAAAVGVIAISLGVLSNQPWEGLLAAALALSGVLLAFAQSLKMISSIKDISLENIGLFLLATLAVIPIGLALFNLASQPWEGLLAAGIAMSATVLAFALALKTISSIKDISLKNIALFLLATLAVIPIGAALFVLAGQPWEGLLAGAVAISAVILALTAAMGLISMFKPDLDAIALFGLGIIAVVGIAASLYILSTQPIDSMLAAAVAISTVLLALSASVAVAGIAGAAAGPAIVGLGVMVAFLAAFTIVLVALGKIMSDSTVADFLAGGAKILSQIGYALGDFVGSIAGGLLAGLSSGLPEIGDNLSEFMDAASPFFEGSKNIKSGAMQGVKYMAEAFLMLTGGAILDGLTSWLTGGSSLADFGKELAEFGPYFKKYASSVEGLNTKAVEASANAAKILSDMASNLPNSGGLAGQIFGENSLADFGKELAKFGPSIKQYGDDVDGLKTDAVEASANAAKILSDMASNLPNSGGLMAKIFGDNTLSDFGKELAKFGPSIKQYGDDVDGLKTEAVEASANAAKILSEMASNLPNSGGLASKLFGDNTLSDFGKELEAFGPSIMQYADDVKDLNPFVVTASALAAQALVALADNLPNTGGIISWFSGDNDLESFGDSLESFGKSMKKYYNSVDEINVGTLSGVIEEFGKLVDMANKVSGIDTSGMTDFVDSLEDLGSDGVISFIESFASSYTTVTETINTFISTATDAINSKANVFTDEGNEAANNYLTAIGNKYGEANTKGTELANNVLVALGLAIPAFEPKGTGSVNKFLTAISDKYSDATSTGTTLVNTVLSAIASVIPSFNTKGLATANQFLLGIKNKYDLANSTGRNLANNALTGCKGLSTQFYDAGVNAGQGFVNGINSKLQDAIAAGQALSNAVLAASATALDEHSPSKKMGEIGTYAALGFINSLMSYISKAHDAGEALSNATLNGANKAINDISEVFTSDLSGDPIITPHVDMSEVTKSASDINRLFNQAILFTSRNAGMVSTSFAQRNNNSDDKFQNNANSQKPVIINNNDFTQNNYSPKALSRIDIYRQTNNQFSRFTEAVNRS